MTPTTDASVLLDGHGRVRAAVALTDTTPDALATAVCEALKDLTGTQASVVSSSVLGQGRRAFAMVMLRDHAAGGFLSGTSSAEDGAEALVQAILTALGLEDGIVPAAVGKWLDNDDVRAVTAVEAGAATPAVNAGGRADTHVRLVEALPAPGRLAVTTDRAEYRVLRFPSMAVTVEATPLAAILEDVDAWMAKAEALGP
jgi:hypothetical protein